MTVPPEKFLVKMGGGGIAIRRQLPLKLAWAISVHKSQVYFNSLFEYIMLLYYNGILEQMNIITSIDVQMMYLWYSKMCPIYDGACPHVLIRVFH